ncbi:MULTISPECIES: universal stress protein [Saliphagus]|uniref:Universal stress protein n=1 Tax=Saliphagus infecundisoli TaxID=1849069 RepID=A0ABD5QKU5_9EURY|nr:MULTISPECIES: universal stress protein [Saliphagus]
MNVLLGIAGSDEGIEALEKTVERTLEAGDDLTVAVVDKPEAERSQEATVERAEVVLAEADLEATVRTLEGDPGSSLVDFAEHGGFDRLVIGGGTESPMGKIRLGPIAEFVLLNATTTVTLVR